LILQTVSFETDSFIYLLDYNSGQFSLVQALATKGAISVLIFNDNAGDTYLGVANYRENSGFLAKSSIYRWKTARNFSAGQPRTCCDSQDSFGKFLLVQNLRSVAALSFEFWKVEDDSSSTMYLALVTEGGTSLSLAAASVYWFNSRPPPPRPVVLTSSFLGPCDQLAIDASSSFSSGGRPFIPEWVLKNFSASQVVATSPPYGLAVKNLLSSTALSSSQALQVQLSIS
jgi:hypothetical protein